MYVFKRACMYVCVCVCVFLRVCVCLCSNMHIFVFVVIGQIAQNRKQAWERYSHMDMQLREANREAYPSPPSAHLSSSVVLRSPTIA